MSSLPGPSTSTAPEDYYAFLNVPRDASENDLVRAYRHMSRLWHPDRHVDPTFKPHAEVMFGKVKSVYDVLRDPARRRIYDTLGADAVEMQGWTIATRHPGADQIRNEYDRLVKQREREKIVEALQPSLSVHLVVDAADLFMADDDEFSFLNACSLESASLNTSANFPLIGPHAVRLSSTVSTKNGVGDFGVQAAYTGTLDAKTNAAVTLGIGNASAGILQLTRQLNQRWSLTGTVVNQYHKGQFLPSFRLGLGTQLDQRWAGSVTGSLGAHNLMATRVVYDDFRKHRLVTQLEVGASAGLMLSYTRRLSEDAGVKASLRLRHNGIGLNVYYYFPATEFTVLNLGWNYVLGKRLMLRLKFVRGQHNYLIDFVLADEDIPTEAVLYGVIAPLLLWHVGKLFLQPLKDKWRLRSQVTAAIGETAVNPVKDERDQYRKSNEILLGIAARSRKAEQKINGLVISRALYGRMWAVDAALALDSSTEQHDGCIDVSNALQCLVIDSELKLHASSKSSLPGFYDLCPSVDKYLRVDYSFDGKQHRVVVPDSDAVCLPDERHRIH